MPTYQYACIACDESLEVVQRFTDDPLTECAECGGRLRKVFSPVGIVFKGPGFYRTDSRKGSGSGADKVKDGQVTGSANGSSSESGKPAGGDKASPSGDKKTSEKPGTTSNGSSSSSAAKVA